MGNSILKLDLSDYYSPTCQSYTSTKIYIGLASAPDAGTVKLRSPFDQCREVICDRVRRILCLNKSGLDKTRLVIHKLVGTHATKKIKKLTAEGLESEITTAALMLNLFEKAAGWPLTKTYPLKYEPVINPTKSSKASKESLYYYIVGTKRWIKAPAMLSLFTLMIKLSNILLVQEIKKLNSGIKSVEELYEKLNEIFSLRGKDGRLISYYKDHYDTWLPIILNYDKLFARTSMKDLYAKSSFHDGIDFLSRLRYTDEKTTATVKKILASGGGKNGN